MDIAVFPTAGWLYTSLSTIQPPSPLEGHEGLQILVLQYPGYRPAYRTHSDVIWTPTGPLYPPARWLELDALVRKPQFSVLKELSLGFSPCDSVEMSEYSGFTNMGEQNYHYGIP